MLIDDTEKDGLAWDRVYNELGFQPGMQQSQPFHMKHNYVVFDIKNMTENQRDIMDELVKRAFINCTKAGELMYALDWQHSSFLYNPRMESEQKSFFKEDVRYHGGGYNAYFPSFYPDGDYYFFIDENFRFGYLGHPWRQEVWIFGDALIREFEGIYEKLGWRKKMEQNHLLEFLIRAKKNTYAAHGAEVASSRVASHDLQYIEDDYMYYDTYLGGAKFSGEEAVWIQDKPVWSMNYTGRVIGEGFSGDFLKEALMEVSTEMPYRGPASYENSDYRYVCKVDGEFHWFQGYEEIFYQGSKIYECYFHGGEVQ
ncbi:MAG: DUF2716 domain-containing protein [Lachnospiraceae bacterium]|nr:DUF2716 domain-containing protein [Lachnospiraceae bacterium]